MCGNGKFGIKCVNLRRGATSRPAHSHAPVEEVQRGGQIPHLDSAVTVTRQHEPARHKQIENIYTEPNNIRHSSPNLLGLDPILLLPSHSWTQKLVMTEPSTDLISHTRVPTEASRTVITSVSGITCNITLTITTSASKSCIRIASKGS